MTLFTPPPMAAIIDSPRLIVLLVLGFVLSAAFLSATGLPVWVSCLLGIGFAFPLEGLILHLMAKANR